jgi:lipopolysaccharide export system protein LptA
MKLINCVILFFAWGVLVAASQTNISTNGGALIAAGQTNVSTNGVNAILALVTTNQMPAATNHSTTPQSSRGPTIINADGPMEADWDNRLVTYRHNVHVTGTQMKMTCEWLLANLPQGSEHVTNIVAETNVIADFTDEKGQQYHATGNKAVYFYHVENGITNENVTLTGGPGHKPKLYRAEDTLTGDSIIWNFVTHKLHVEHPEGIGWPETNKTPAITNSPVIKTNQPAETNG